MENMGRVFRCNLSIFRRAFGESKYRQITSKDESHIFHTDFLLEHNPFITPLKIIDRLYWSRNFNKKKYNGITQPEHSKQQLCVANPRLIFAHSVFTLLHCYDWLLSVLCVLHLWHTVFMQHLRFLYNSIR